jgi:hypothetical protein
MFNRIRGRVLEPLPQRRCATQNHGENALIRRWDCRTGYGSFDCVAASLRETDTSLRMTGYVDVATLGE